jgi:oxygen-independent coproporphyrinogen III oxidase
MTEFPSHEQLIRMYDVPTPRYTSYPTVPHWKTDTFTTEKWIEAVRASFDESNDSDGIGLYVHLPFCESLCTYCACNKRITTNHGVEIAYIRSLLKEWSHYLRIFGRKPTIREIHLGGGTPTFFSPKNLRWLISYLLEEGTVHDDHEFSFEGHPNNTTAEHSQTLFELGFRRVSFGVQDFDSKVQQTINRIQPFENLQSVMNNSRAIGYSSISFDLIYGLPFQTTRTIEDTFQKILLLRPDRVSFYSYAHVPWVSPGQRGYDASHLPGDLQKRRLYETGRQLLKENGYRDVGMDHFALPHDPLFQAQANGTLHRDFMGYTTTNTDLLIGLGASAISDAKYAYAQNQKKVEHYLQAIADDHMAVFKGHMHTDGEMLIRQAILQLACNGSILFESVDALDDTEAIATLDRMCNEGILERTADSFRITEHGRIFVRNVCAAFDRNLRKSADAASTSLFSKSI